MAHNHWLFLMFGIYVVDIFLFGGVYFLIYRRDRRHYSFAADVLNNQRVEFASRSKQELEKLAIEAEMYITLREKLISGEPAFLLTDGGATATLPSGARVVLTRVVEGGAPGSLRLVLYVNSFDPAGQRLRHSSADKTHPKTNDDFLRICVEQSEWIEKRTERLQERRATLDSAQPDVWSYIDFLYFSTITQTTVGYGDILPNSSTVRLCVTVQILIGYLLLAILLNIVFSAP